MTALEAKKMYGLCSGTSLPLVSSPRQARKIYSACLNRAERLREDRSIQHVEYNGNLFMKRRTRTVLEVTNGKRECSSFY